MSEKKEARQLEIPSVELLEGELKRTQYNARYRRTLRTTVFSLLLVAAAAVIIAVLLLPILQISGGSMENTLMEGDMVISLNDSKYKTGDIITFRADLNGDGEEELLTHRIYQVNQDGSYYTKGDANAIYDQADTASPKLRSVYPSDVLAVYHGTKIGGLGNVLNFLRSSQGFFFCILLPMIIFFIYQAIRVIMNVIAYNKEKAMVAAQEAIQNSELTEEQKARAIAEYLEKEKAKAAEAADAADETDGESEGDEASDEDEV